ncbi:MAG: hypothetical protein GY722_07625 [bacterium]|nr:hypothetical protein [bacterium]
MGFDRFRDWSPDVVENVDLGLKARRPFDRCTNDNADSIGTISERQDMMWKIVNMPVITWA